MPNSRVVFDSGAIEDALRRLAEQVVSSTIQPDNVALVGIQTGGIHLAERLARLLETRFNRKLPVGCLDVNMHRDDLGSRVAPALHPTSIPFDIDGMDVIILDDVLFHGRTVRAALDALNDFGRPRRVQLAVLIDRGHRELPIQADYVAEKIETNSDEEVVVQWKEDNHEEVVLVNKK
ncbi:MAG: bifunctional pyr operon transcriptional regulator/uracil phosphoribosyltransferase PyrR [Verrucomicrobia bacterium]|nr:bifunctional pyr operon transcriptional regulator/uracil phosphoribosyltransferase PyrR [Verrucomicrobiota bacterium]MCF7709321.1 bifunctional pyr operon transcriptional regulator/uracil phosphoribosyltransferase PyrR [Verrucomicrobiota bacterium]